MKIVWNMILVACVGLILACMIILCGCTSTQIEYGTFKIKRTSFLQSVNVRAEATAEGNIYVNYANDGGGEQAGNVIGSAAKTMIKNEVSTWEMN